MSSVDLMPGERVIWSGRPRWRSLARTLVHADVVAAYFAVWLLWGAHVDRSAGLSPAATLMAALPLAVLAAGVLGACVAMACWCAATTTYLLTDERCVLVYGMALTATLSLPLRRIAEVSVASRSGDGGDVALTLMDERGVGYLRTWPNVRPWHWRRPQPMLRDIGDAAAVAEIIGAAVRRALADPAIGTKAAPAARPALTSVLSSG